MTSVHIKLRTAHEELFRARALWNEHKGTDDADKIAAKQLYLEAGRNFKEAQQAVKDEEQG